MIKINDRYLMENDSTCLTLYESKVVIKGKNSGKEYLESIAHFGSGRYDQLFIHLSEIGTAGLDSFDEILEYYKSLKNDINELLRPEGHKSVSEFLQKVNPGRVTLASDNFNQKDIAELG